MDYLITFILLVIITILFILWTKTRRDSNWPPGPKTVPFIGNLTINFSDMLGEFRRFRGQYGDVFSLVLGSETVVVVNGLDTLKDLFVKHADVASIRPDNFMFRDINKHQGIGGSSGALWKEHRTFAISTLREFGFGKRSMESKIMEEVEVFINCVKEKEGVAFNISDLLHSSVSNIICSVALGHRFEHEDKYFKELLSVISENLNNSDVTGLLTFLPYLKYIPGDPIGYGRVMRNVRLVYGFIQQFIDDRKKETIEEVPTNYLDAYIKHQSENEDIKHSTFTDEQLQFALGDIFAAGSETTATAVKWFILSMLYRPDIQQRMRNEILAVVGDSRFPSLADRDKLTYCDAVLHETLRFGNIAPLSVPHGLTRDLEFRGYIIPQNAMILPCLDSVLNDPEIFKNPSEFIPERFLSSEGSLTDTDKVPTFGIGRRICIGESLARMELFLFASSLIQRFQLLPPEDASLPAMTDYKLGITRAPLPYVFRAVPVRSIKRTVVPDTLSLVVRTCD